jgi:Domain of unknown function (DUF6894)
MPAVFFRCSSAKRMLPNLCTAEVEDLTDARAQAAMAVRMLLALPGVDDWRDWVMHVIDDLGEEIFALPFKSIMGPRTDGARHAATSASSQNSHDAYADDGADCRMAGLAEVPVRSLSARAPLHARARPEMAREA